MANYRSRNARRSDNLNYNTTQASAYDNSINIFQTDGNMETRSGYGSGKPSPYGPREFDPYGPPPSRYKKRNSGNVYW